VPPGVLVSVQSPEAGNPLITTLPVTTEHVGCVIVPIVGAAGVAEIVTDVVVVKETQPPAAGMV
jgi:hypothetical protein